MVSVLSPANNNFGAGHPINHLQSFPSSSHPSSTTTPRNPMPQLPSVFELMVNTQPPSKGHPKHAISGTDPRTPEVGTLPRLDFANYTSPSDPLLPAPHSGHQYARRLEPSGDYFSLPSNRKSVQPPVVHYPHQPHRSSISSSIELLSRNPSASLINASATILPRLIPAPAPGHYISQAPAGPVHYFAPPPTAYEIPVGVPPLGVVAHPPPPTHPAYATAPPAYPHYYFESSTYADPGNYSRPLPHSGTAAVDENNALINRRRIIKRRTRTGCLTCRKRRIKCDERKPHCFNCERSKKVCLGYENKAKSEKRNSEPDLQSEDTLEPGSKSNRVSVHQLTN